MGEAIGEIWESGQNARADAIPTREDMTLTVRKQCLAQVIRHPQPKPLAMISPRSAYARLRQLAEKFPLDQAVIMLAHFMLVVFFAGVTPLLLRQFSTVAFIEREEPLEFTFQTCTDLAGVCSFPEAMVSLEDVSE